MQPYLVVCSDLVCAEDLLTDDPVVEQERHANLTAGAMDKQL